MFFRIKLLLTHIIFIIAVFFASISLIQASENSVPDLNTLFEWAYQNDADYREALLQLEAAEEIAPQSKAGLLPDVTLNADASYSMTNPESPFPSEEGGSEQLGIEVSQALFDTIAWQTYREGQANQARYNADQRALEQDFLFSVIEQLLAVLRARVGLELSTAEHQAQNKRLTQIQQRYQAGMLPITDVLEAQAAYDLADADLLAARNELNITQNALSTTIGHVPEQLPDLKTNYPIVEPKKLDLWLTQAVTQNPELKSLEAALQAAEANQKKARHGHTPTLRLDAAWYTDSGYQSVFDSPDQETSRISLRLEAPLYQGGAISSAKREANLRLDAAKAAVEAKKRQLAQTIKTTHSSVLTDMQRIRAQKQAIKSAEAALRATEASYQAGSREIVDVLLTEQQVYSAKNRHANARYDYLSNQLALHQAEGSLTLSVIKSLNTWFE